MAVFDTEISFVGISDGTATIRVAGQDVSCVAGQTLTVGGVRLTCTDVTTETVEFDISPD